MRDQTDYGGRRVLIISGKYKCKKGFVSSASCFGIYVDLDYNALRILVATNEIMIIDDSGNIDK